MARFLLVASKTWRMSHMITAKIAGAVIVVIPAIVLAWGFLWRRNRAVFWFALALIAVGLGYLTVTGATDDIANRLVPRMLTPAPGRVN